MVVVSIIAVSLWQPAVAGGERSATADVVGCAATGYLMEQPSEGPTIRPAAPEQPVPEVGGVALSPGETWIVPDNSHPVVVMESTTDLADGSVAVVVAGRKVSEHLTTFEEPSRQVIVDAAPGYLGTTLRSAGLTVRSGACELSIGLSTSGPVWSTVAGGAALAVSVLAGMVTVAVARRRGGGWFRRCGIAAPAGLLAGAAQGVVLLEAAVVSPFAGFPWWAPLAGLGAAALLPLTRGRRRSAPAAAGPPALGPPPRHALLGGFHILSPVARTDIAGIYRASRPTADGSGEDERALVKVVLPERAGEPAAWLRLSREAKVLSGLSHPNVLRLRETWTSDEPIEGRSPASPPTLVFDDVGGAPLRTLLSSRGALSGPQAVTVLLGVLAALQLLHARQLVHRGVCPENVWLAEDGRVRLTGFDLACSGVEHPVAPEGATAYASPEQRAARVLDPRSDLWACGVLLHELLTGQPQRGARSGRLPDPLAQLLARVCAENPTGRPDSADQFATELRAVAEQTYGADWAGRGLLAGALTTHGAIGAATAGYALGGGPVVGSAGVGAGKAPASGAGLGSSPASESGVAVSGAARQPESIGAAAAGGPQAAAGGAAGAVVTAVVGAVIAAGTLVVGGSPAEAQAVVITPEHARLIFVQTIDEARGGDRGRLAAAADDGFLDLLSQHPEVTESVLVEVTVGVPPEQFDYPAWFLAAGRFPVADGYVEAVSRFERNAEAAPWLMTSFGWLGEVGQLAGPRWDSDGWLAEPDSRPDFVIDPGALPELYVEWARASISAGEVADHEVLAPWQVSDDRRTGIAELVSSGPAIPQVSTSYEFDHESAAPSLIWLGRDGGLITFSITSTWIRYNSPQVGVTKPCDRVPIAEVTDPAEVGVFFSTAADPTQEFRQLAFATEIQVYALVPTPDAERDEAEPPVVLVADPTLTSTIDHGRSVRC